MLSQVLLLFVYIVVMCILLCKYWNTKDVKHTPWGTQLYGSFCYFYSGLMAFSSRYWQLHHLYQGFHPDIADGIISTILHPNTIAMGLSRKVWHPDTIGMKGHVLQSGFSANNITFEVRKKF